MLGLMGDLLKLIWWLVAGFFRSRASLEAEILTLRHQLIVLQRKAPKRLVFSNFDRLVFASLYRLAPGILNTSEQFRNCGHWKLTPQQRISGHGKARRSNGAELANAQFPRLGDKLGKGRRFFTSLAIAMLRIQSTQF